MISIRLRLTLLLCLAMGALFIITGAGVYFTMEKILLTRFDETLTAKARALITASEVDEGEFEIDLTVQDFAGFGLGGDDYFEIRRAKGSLVLRSPSLRGFGHAIDRFDRFEVPVKDKTMIVRDALADGRPARFYLQKIYPKDDAKNRYQDLVLIVASPTRTLQRELGVLATVLASAGGVAIFLMVPLIRFGMGMGLRPLNKLSENIGSIRTGDLHRRLPTESLPAELKPVALGLNKWLERLEKSFERERRFSSHAAHELRTPLAEIRSIAELGARWSEEATQERCMEIIAVSGEMETLLDKLSLLARADAGRQPVELEAHDLAGLVTATLSRYEEKIRERKLDVQCAISGETIITDHVIWNAIFQNLVGNAVSHTPPGSVVKLEVSPHIISVANPAPDLASEDLAHIFERFWRKDESRSGYGHSGLGMSIVKVCASLLGGNCAAVLTDSKVLRAEVSWQSGDKE